MPAAVTTAASSSFVRAQVLVGALIVQLILGTVYGYSVFWQPLDAKIFPPVVTQVEYDQMPAAETAGAEIAVVADEDARQIRLAEQAGYLKYAFAICVLSFALTMVVAGRLQDVTGPRLPALIGAVLLGGGFILAGLMDTPLVFYLAHAALVGGGALVLMMLYQAVFAKVDKSRYPILEHVPHAIMVSSVVAGILLGQQYVGRLGEMDRLFLLWGTVGFLSGAGIGFAYVCPIAALVKWFPKHKGLVSGVAVAGFGFGAFIFKGRALGAVGYIERNDVLNFFIVHGLISLVCVSAGAMLLRNPPAPPEMSSPESSDATAQASTQPAAQSNSTGGWQDTLRQPTFYLLWLMFFSGALAGLMVIGIIKPFAGSQLVESAAAAGRTLGESDRAALLAKGAAAVGYLAIFNAVGRVVWGVVSDRIGRTTSFVVMFLFQAAAMFTLATCKTELTLAIGASIVGFNFGGCFALFPSATADLFGTKNMGANYGWVFTSYGIAGVVGIAAGNAAKVVTGSYFAAFVMAAVMCLISAGLAVSLGRLTKKSALTQ